MRPSGSACLAVRATILLSSALARAAEGVPKLDIEPSCRAAADSSLGVGRNDNTCRADENGARDTLKRDWSKFSVSDKSNCQSLVKTGGPPSYVELLSCLEASRDARQIAQRRPGSADTDQQPQTTGAGTAGTRSSTRK